MDLAELELGGQIGYIERQLPISRYLEYVSDSGALVQTAEVDVDHESAKLVFGLNATPDRTKHSVTVRRGEDDAGELYFRVSAVYGTDGPEDGSDTRRPAGVE